MRIFFLCQRVPFPPDRGDKITTFHELRHLAARHEVHVFCLADGTEDLANVPGALRHARTVTAIARSGRAGRIRALRALAAGGSLSVAMLDEPALHDAIREAHARLRPDLVFVYSSNMAQYAEPFAATPRIMQFADLDSLKFARYAETTRRPMAWIHAIEARRLFDYERRIARSFSHSLVCTEIEAADFRRLIPGAPLDTVGNGVDLDHFRSAGVAREAGAIIFTGVMDYRPNVDAVTWFCDAILPVIQRSVPDARFVICGSRPTEAVRRLGDRPGVTVTGRVEDIRPHLDRAEVFVAPLRIARGIQNKVLEALAMGLPVVASTATWKGTGLAAGEGILPADSASEFADHLVRLMTDRACRDAMAARARSAAERHLAWDRQLARLDAVIDGLVATQRVRSWAK